LEELGFDSLRTLLRTCPQTFNIINFGSDRLQNYLHQLV